MLKRYKIAQNIGYDTLIRYRNMYL